MILATHGVVASQILQVPIFEFSVKTNNAGVSTSTQFRMPLTTSTGLNFDVNWGDGSPIETITNHTLAIHTYSSAGTYTIKVTGSILGWQFANGGDKLKMLNVFSWGALIISVNQGFYGCSNLTCSATDAPTITTLSLFRYFRDCGNFNGAIGNWDVVTVQELYEMFRATAFNQNIGSWNVTNVNSMRGMFQGNSVFNQNIGNWNVINVTTFESMFEGTSAFSNSGNSSIGNWNTTNATNMRYMFNGTAINQNLSTKTINAGLPNEYIAWNVTNVTQMDNMFRDANAFNQDIGNWNISNVTNFANFMLGKTSANYSAANLDSIYNGWSSRSVKPNLTITFGSIKYTAASAAGRLILTSAPNNWTITDGGI
jgi:surface protein